MFFSSSARPTQFLCIQFCPRRLSPCDKDCRTVSYQLILVLYAVSPKQRNMTISYLALAKKNDKEEVIQGFNDLTKITTLTREWNIATLTLFCHWRGLFIQPFLRSLVPKSFARTGQQFHVFFCNANWALPKFYSRGLFLLAIRTHPTMCVFISVCAYTNRNMAGAFFLDDDGSGILLITFIPAPWTRWIVDSLRQVSVCSHTCPSVGLCTLYGQGDNNRVFYEEKWARDLCCLGSISPLCEHSI